MEEQEQKPLDEKSQAFYMCARHLAEASKFMFKYNRLMANTLLIMSKSVIDGLEQDKMLEKLKDVDSYEVDKQKVEEIAEELTKSLEE